MSCGGGGLRMSLCPDTRVNTDRELLLNRLASSHVYHSATAAADYCTHTRLQPKEKKTFYTHILQLEETQYNIYWALHSCLNPFYLDTKQVKLSTLLSYLIQDIGFLQEKIILPTKKTLHFLGNVRLSRSSS